MAHADQILDRWRTAPYTYVEVGATAGPLPAGYRHVRIRADLGSGAGTFDRAADLLLSWEMHRRAGIDLVSTDRTAVPGAVVLQRIRVGPVRVDAACRVVAVGRTPQRAGFAYGTLSGHPVAGEEAFGLQRLADDRVVATVTAFSRPDRWFTRLGGRLGDVAQDLMLRRYVAALRAG